MIVANAAYRLGLQHAAADKAAAVQALNEAANGYLTVLKNNRWNEEAAHNYEYTIRLRDLVAKGQKPPNHQPEKGADLGQGGAPSPATSTKGFEVYSPLEGSEKSPDAGEAGKAGEKKRKG
jgi:hypothetical protein